MRGAKRTTTHVEKTSYTLYPSDYEALMAIGEAEFTGPSQTNMSGIIRHCIQFTYRHLTQAS